MAIPIAAAHLAGEAVHIGLTAVASAIKNLYGMGVAINDYIDDHIQQMKKSANQTISRTGDVLEAAKFGFGLGYMSSVIIMATGQLLLGNVGVALGTLTKAATLSNPIAMTCAAVGAIVYGWAALSQAEQEEILGRLTKGLEIGAELIKAVLNFMILKIKELLTSKNVAEFKKYIKEYASKFGKTLHEITHGFTDFIKDTAEATTAAMGKAYDETAKGAVIAAEVTSSALKEAYETTSGAAARAADKTSTAVKDAIETTSDAASNLRKATAKASKRAIVKTVRAASKFTLSNKKPAGLKMKDALPKAESSAVSATSGALKVVAENAEAIREVAEATPKVMKRPSKKSNESARKLSSLTKKTVARKVSSKVSPGNAKVPRRAAA